MIRFFTKIQKGHVSYFQQKGDQIVELTSHNYEKFQLEQASKLYPDVCAFIKTKKVISNDVLKEHFHLDWKGADYLIKRLESEGYCSPYSSAIKGRKILS